MKRWFLPLLLLVLLLGCSSPSAPTSVPVAPTMTPSMIPATLTVTPSPLPPTLVVNVDAYVSVPRYMLISRPGAEIEILGITWQYVTDNWGDRFAQITFKDSNKKREMSQVFVLLEDGETREDLFGAYPASSEPLDVKSDFDAIGKFTVVGLSKDGIALFTTELLTDQYFYGVEIAVPVEDSLSLSELYTQQASELVNYLIHDSLQKSRILPRPSPTPLAPDQQASYDSMGSHLISETDINALYSTQGGTWEYQFDTVKVTQVCRNFEDRTPADVLWVDFRNCVFKVKAGTSMEQVVDYFFRPGDVQLESKYAADRYFVFSYQSGHTYYVAILYEDNLAFLAEVESRTLVGTTPENGFSEYTDDFLHSVLMENAGKNE